MISRNTTSNHQRSRASLWKRLLGWCYTSCRSICSYIFQEERLAHSFEASEQMHELRKAIAVMLHDDVHDTNTESAVKELVTNVWLGGGMPLLLDLSAEGLVRYYNERVVQVENVSENAQYLRDFEALAVFLRVVRLAKGIYYEHGLLDAPTKFMM